MGLQNGRPNARFLSEAALSQRSWPEQLQHFLRETEPSASPGVALEEAHPSIACRKDRERESDSNFWVIQEVLVEVGVQICEPQSELNEQVTTVVSLAVFLPFAFSGAELCSMQFEKYFSEEI